MQVLVWSRIYISNFIVQSAHFCVVAIISGVVGFFMETSALAEGLIELSDRYGHPPKTHRGEKYFVAPADVAVALAPGLVTDSSVSLELAVRDLTVNSSENVLPIESSQVLSQNAGSYEAIVRVRSSSTGELLAEERDRYQVRARPYGEIGARIESLDFSGDYLQGLIRVRNSEGGPLEVSTRSLGIRVIDSAGEFIGVQRSETVLVSDLTTFSRGTEEEVWLQKREADLLIDFRLPIAGAIRPEAILLFGYAKDSRGILDIDKWISLGNTSSDFDETLPPHDLLPVAPPPTADHAGLPQDAQFSNGCGWHSSVTDQQISAPELCHSEITGEHYEGSGFWRTAAFAIASPLSIEGLARISMRGPSDWRESWHHSGKACVSSRQGMATGKVFLHPPDCCETCKMVEYGVGRIRAAASSVARGPSAGAMGGSRGKVKITLSCGALDMTNQCISENHTSTQPIPISAYGVTLPLPVDSQQPQAPCHGLTTDDKRCISHECEAQFPFITDASVQVWGKVSRSWSSLPFHNADSFRVWSSTAEAEASVSGSGSLTVTPKGYGKHHPPSPPVECAWAIGNGQPIIFEGGTIRLDIGDYFPGPPLEPLAPFLPAPDVEPNLPSPPSRTVLPIEPCSTPECR